MGKTGWTKGSPVELQAALSADPDQVAVARRLLRGYLADRSGVHAPDDLDVPVLLMSELVTNAIRHARPPVLLRAATRGGFVRVEVHDGAAAPPVLAEGDLSDPPADGGRGLQLVDSLADRWGWENHASGKTVWFELDVI